MLVALLVAQVAVLVMGWKIAARIDAVLIELRSGQEVEKSLRQTIDSLVSSVDALAKMRDELKREADVRRKQELLTSAKAGGWRSV